MTSLLVALILAACGGGSAGVIPTQTIIPTYNFVQPTTVAGVETTVATSEATAAPAGLDPEVVARGKARYDALACATCHGANGEGTDKAGSLATSTLSEGDFITFMRSGGKVGPTHQFATNRLSISGGAALYQYLLSLRKSS